MTTIQHRTHQLATKYRSFLSVLLVFFFCSILLFVLIGPSLNADFHIIDDHEVITPEMHSDTLQSIVQIDFNTARFRPLYWAIYLAEIRIFGANPLPWHITVFAIGVATLSLFYGVLHEVKLQPVYIILALMTLLTYPGSAAIWWRLGPQEGLGSLLLLMSIYGLVKLWRKKPNRSFWIIVFITSSTLMCFQKESFVLTIPALMAAYWWLGIRPRWPVAAIAFVSAIILAVDILAILVSPRGYGLQVTQMGILSLNTVRNNLVMLVPPLTLGIPALYMLLKAKRRLAAVSLLLLGLWVLPQTLLYSRLFYERFLWPAIIGIALICAFTYARVPRVLLLLTLVLSVPAWFPNLLYIRQDAERFTEQTYKLRDDIEQLKSGHGPILVIGDPVSQYEEIVSIQLFFKWRGVQRDVCFITPITGDKMCTPKDLEEGEIYRIQGLT